MVLHAEATLARYADDLAKLVRMREDVAHPRRVVDPRSDWTTSPAELWRFEREMHQWRAAALEASAASGLPMPAEPPGMDGPTPPVAFADRRDARLDGLWGTIGFPADATTLRTFVLSDAEGSLVFALTGPRRRVDPQVVSRLLGRDLTILGPREAAIASGWDPGVATPFGGDREWTVLLDTAVNDPFLDVEEGRPGRVRRLRRMDAVNGGAVRVLPIAVDDPDREPRPPWTPLPRRRDVRFSWRRFRVERRRLTGERVEFPSELLGIRARATDEQLDRWIGIITRYRSGAASATQPLTEPQRIELRDAYREYLWLATAVDFVPELPIAGLGDD
jgi:hypothetical protein